MVLTPQDPIEEKHEVLFTLQNASNLSDAELIKQAENLRGINSDRHIMIRDGDTIRVVMYVLSESANALNSI